MEFRHIVAEELLGCSLLWANSGHRHSLDHLVSQSSCYAASDADFRGKLLLVYFGYTYCTDICPTDLQAISTAIDKLGPAGESVQPLFITVDPERDTPEAIKLYVALFHPRLIGLTGNAKQIKTVARAYKVYYANNEQSKKSDPVIDHSGFVILVGRDGKYLGFFPPGTSADRMIDSLRPQLAITQR
jgi:protein SCO1/2